VNRFASVKPCLYLPRNAKGRGFVVGDLHGHRALLEHELSRLSFDPRCDRVLSVGDLVDRGPDSVATLSLIEEPWFHAVLGDHELMLLNDLSGYGSRLLAWQRRIGACHRQWPAGRSAGWEWV
jgi:serine/threonine protein phosphatase 1